MDKRTLLDTAIQSGMQKKPKPTKREKQQMSKVAVAGVLLFGIVIIVTMIMQLGNI